ncbi:MAG TPA: hypothetical protein VEG30_18160 [Terriglobales bacterium]|nr:hypothetical protein [Terriglobales bacterium]
MIDLHLVRLIESHADELAQALMQKLQASHRCSDMERVPSSEMQARVLEVYKNLTDWLLNKTEEDIEATYKHLGRRRWEQGVRFDHLYWALIVVKENLWDFLQEEGVAETQINLYGALELLHLTEQFFDRAIYHAAVGYREASRTASVRAA